jgi:RimJ/RimL family protein N-acetyltransferase
MKLVILCFFLGSILSATSLSVGEPKESFLFETTRLRAYAATADRITTMAGLLNQTDGNGRLNGKYYEDGLEKGPAWILHMQEQVLEKKFSTCIFFYAKDDLSTLACVVGREPRYAFPTVHRMIYVTNIDQQGKGYTSEAVRGFLKFLPIDTACESLELSIHPENAASLRIATDVIGAAFLLKAGNVTGTQERHVYSIRQEALTKKILSYPEVLSGVVMSSTSQG